MVSCPEPASPVSRSAIIDWVDFVQLDGILYMPPAGVAPGALGEPYGRVAFKLSGNVSDPSYRARDCDGAFLEPGTVFYTVKGYDPRFRIALADGTVYESYRREGARTAGVFIDLRGKVTAIEFRDSLDDGGAVVGRIADATEVERLVGLFLASEFDDARQPTSTESDLPSVKLTFQLSDGTEFMRGYQPAIGRVWPGIWVPELFNEAAEAAMRQP